jgi:hypothetical protein
VGSPRQKGKQPIPLSALHLPPARHLPAWLRLRLQICLLGLRQLRQIAGFSPRSAAASCEERDDRQGFGSVQMSAKRSGKIGVSERIHRRVRHDKVPPEKRRSKQMAIWHATSTSYAARQSIGTKYSDIRPLDANRDDLSPRSGTFNSLQIQQPVMAQQAGPSRSGCAGRMRRPMLKSVLAGQVRKDRRKSPQSHPS